MKNKKSIILSISLIMVGIVIIITNVILKNFNWHFRSWILTLSFIIIHIGIICFISLKIRKIKSRNKRYILLVIWIFISIFIILINFTLFGLIIKIDNVKEIDGKKYIGIEYLSNRARKTIYYYDTYNIFAYHKTEEYIEEFYDYDNYECPKYRKYNKIPQTDSIIYYYDEDGNITDIKN